jgi:hypothetical protein
VFRSGAAGMEWRGVLAWATVGLDVGVMLARSGRCVLLGHDLESWAGVRAVGQVRWRGVSLGAVS